MIVRVISLRLERTIVRNIGERQLDATTTQEQISKKYGYKDEKTTQRLIKEARDIIDTMAKLSVTYQIDQKKTRLEIEGRFGVIP